jgi:hypothetical protein
MAEKRDFQSKKVEDHVHFMLVLAVYITCIIFFVANSFAIFQGFLSNPTIISTKVVKSPSRLLEFPSILICNEKPFKTSGMITDYLGYKSNTLSLEEFLVDMKFGKNIGQAVLNVTLKSIKGTLQEVLTAFHGTCFLSQEKLQVG